MRINKFLALATGESRRAIDSLIQEGSVQVNSKVAMIGQDVTDQDVVLVNNVPARLRQATTVMLNKPVGYVCSRDGQGSKTIYDLLPPQYHNLKPVGRLDKDSSGLLLLTNDGDLAHKLTHPSFQKEKVYLITVKPELAQKDKQRIEVGIELEDGISKLQLEQKGKQWQVTMHEGRNRQIRRTFEALGYNVQTLHRTTFGDYTLTDLKPGSFKEL